MKKILLIEDDPFLIDIYTTKLKEAGFSIDFANSGDSGLEKLREKKYALLLLDIVLPKSDGWQILSDIKNMPQKYQELKIIILSNLGQKEDVEKGLKMGATKYLIKAHYTPSEVVEEIREILK